MSTSDMNERLRLNEYHVDRLKGRASTIESRMGQLESDLDEINVVLSNVLQTLRKIIESTRP